MRNVIVFISVLCLLGGEVSAQYNGAEVPEIGKKFESFHIHDSRNDAFFNDTLKMFKGKYLIFDFFSSGCGACFRSFPKIKQLQEKFHNKLQFILVGYEDKHIRKLFGVYQKKLKLDIPVVYDSVFANFAVPVGFPHLIWIDAHGVVKAITSKSEMTDVNIEQFINDKNFEFSDRSHSSALTRNFLNDNQASQGKFDWFFVEDDNGIRVARTDIDTNYFFRTEIGRWKPHMTIIPPSIVRNGPNANKAIIGMGSLATLLSFAYLGKGRWDVPDQLYPIDSNDIYFKVFPKLEVASTDSLAIYADLEHPNSLYWYRLIMKHKGGDPDSVLLSQMKLDLKRTFGYRARFVNRKVKCYCLIANGKTKRLLRSKGGKPQVSIDKTHLQVTNMPMSSFSNILLRKYLRNSREEKYYYDDTNIDMNIDISISGVLYEAKEVQKILKKYGLDIVECEREMVVLKIEKIE